MLKPIRNNVLVRAGKPKTATASGLLIPHQAADKLNNPELARSEVVAVGPGFWSDEGEWINPDVKAGDIVYYGGINYSGLAVEEDGVEYRMLREVDILMKEEA
jgi:chaperonin GroES